MRPARPVTLLPALCIVSFSKRLIENLHRIAVSDHLHCEWLEVSCGLGNERALIDEGAVLSGRQGRAQHFIQA
jgi:hypothetical protein